MVFKNLLKDFYGDIINIKLNIKKNKKLRRIKDHLIYDVISKDFVLQILWRLPVKH